MSGQYVEVDVHELKDFCDRLDRMASSDTFKRECREFMESIGDEFLRIVQDEIIRREVVDTRLLLNSFQKGTEGNIWSTSDGGLTVEVGTNVEYASYVNDGHWTCGAGEKQRWVPGRWNGDKFIYEPGADTGMLLKQKWIPGRHFWDSAIRIIDRMFPELMERKLDEMLNRYL